jgi:hypothetical protein
MYNFFKINHTWFILNMCKSLFKMEDFHFEYSLTSMESQFKMCHFKLFLTHI